MVYCEQKEQLHLVAGSQANAQAWQSYYPVCETIYHRLGTQALPACSAIHDGGLVFVGRIDPSKGVEDAIEVAVMLGKSLDIYGAPLAAMMPYFAMQIQPLLQEHANIRYHGLVSQEVLQKRLLHAQALLFPIKWHEPFGYVTLEAMSLGTPVIMYDRGAARELIVEDTNGFIGNSGRAYGATEPPALRGSYA